MKKITKTYPIECKTCNGEGEVSDNSTMGIYNNLKRTCKACKGTGVITIIEVTEPLYPINIDTTKIQQIILKSNKKDGKNKNK